ncbi:hypothetical protein BTUL_0051g00580 [Botrytis tulipae]|uniref:Uncharacterized protein n=1 Tax=Botrytis tulipae TaxID=87230 RepID=A0A4Z1EUS9_9HELO|nr:hypothetical protein BTUL_0051g00580 [Botrytis tulipae]
MWHYAVFARSTECQSPILGTENISKPQELNTKFSHSTTLSHESTSSIHSFSTKHETMARIEVAPRPKVARGNLIPKMAPLVTQSPAPKPRKSSKRGNKRRRGKTLITKAVEKLAAVLKKPQSTNIEKAEACFKVTYAKMKAYEQEEEGRGKWNAAAARQLEARLGKTFHEDKMNEYLEAAKEECRGASDIYCGIPNLPEFLRTEFWTIVEYWSQYPGGREGAFIVYKHDMPDGAIRFTLRDGTQVKTGRSDDVGLYDKGGNLR